MREIQTYIEMGSHAQKEIMEQGLVPTVAKEVAPKVEEKPQPAKESVKEVPVQPVAPQEMLAPKRQQQMMMMPIYYIPQ